MSSSSRYRAKLKAKKTKERNRKCGRMAVRKPSKRLKRIKRKSN